MKMIAAVAQTATVMFDTPATVAKAQALMQEAAGRGAQVLVFPEAFIGGYPKGADFHIFIGARTPEGRQDFKKYYDAAVTLDGPEIAQLAQAAGQHRLYVCVGIIERDGGTLYCTAVYLGPEGTVLGHHRKLMPTALERLVWGAGRWLHAASGGHALRQARRRDLLGKLHARAAHGHVPAARGAVLRAHGRRP